MLFKIVITKRKLNGRNKRYDIIVNCISAKILTEVQIYYLYNIICLHIKQYPYVSKQFESGTVN